MAMTIEAPWQTYAKKLKALFENDPQIEVGDIYKNDSDEYQLYIEVKSHTKFLALDHFLPGNAVFGKVVLKITLFDLENKSPEENEFRMIEDLFKDNPIIEDIVTTDDITGAPHCFVLFKPEVLQFFDDNMWDYNGFWHGLAQDIAKNVFSTNAGIHFCTAKKEEINNE